MREALRVQMMEFGRTPRQLFRKPHPRRKVRQIGDVRARCFGIRPARAPVSPRPPNVLRPAFHVCTLLLV